MIKSLRTLVCLVSLLSGLSAVSQAQNLLTGTLSASSVCPPGTLTVPFSATGPFGTGNTFTAQLSDGSGSFSGTVTSIGSITASPTSATTLAITATIPGTASVSASYKVRVIASAVAVASSSPTSLAIGTTAPAAPASTPAFCQNTSPASVSAVGQNLKWYASTAAATVSGSGATFPVSTTATGTFTVYVTQTVNGCESGRTPVSYTVTSLPAAPVVSVPAPYCTNVATYPVATATGSGLQWYNALGMAVGSTAPVPMLPGSYSYTVSQSSGSCVSPKSPSYTITVYPKAAAPTLASAPYCANTPPTALLVTGTNLQWFTSAAGSTTITQPSPTTITQTLYVQQSDANGCRSDITPLTVTVNSQPPPPAVTPSLTICTGTTATLTATALPGNTLRWYGTNPQGSYTTSPVAPATAGVQYVSQVSSSGCESDKAQINVSVNTPPGVPLTAPSVPICAGQTANALSATPTTPGASLRWYTDLTTAVYTTSAPVPSNQTSSTYYVAQADQSGCTSGRVSVVTTVKKRPTALVLSTAQSRINLCQNLSAQPLTATLTDGTSLNWYDNNSTTPLSSAPTPPTGGTGTLVYQVSQVLDGCEGPLSSITVTVNAIPPMPTVAAAGPYCQGTTIPALSATGQNLKWYGVNATGGTATATQVPDNSAPGIVNYYVSQTVSGCESARGSVAVQVKLTPGVPGVTSLDFCQNTPAPALTAIPTSNATLNWYGTSPTGPSTTTPPMVPNTTATTLTYYVSQSLDGCEGAKASLTVRVKQKPGVPGTSPIAFCNNAPSQPLTATGQNLTWYDQNNALLGNAPMPNTGAIGTQTYKVSQTTEGCVSDPATLIVTINALPTAPGTSNLQYCLPTPDQPAQSVNPLSAGGQNLKWYNPDGNLYSQAPTPPISQTAVINYQVTQTVNNCEGPKATLQVLIQTTPAPVTPKPLVTYCRNDVAAPLEATGANLRWIDPNNTLLPPNTTPTPPTLNATRQGGVFYQVYQTGINGCVSPRASIKVIINTNPTLAITGATSINLGQTTPLQLHFTGAAPFSYTLSNGISSTALNDTTVSVTPRQTTVYQVVDVANVCGNGLPGDPASALITVKVPTITTGNLNSSILCAGSTFTVPYATAGDFNLDLGYQVQLVSATDTSARNPITLNATGTINNPIPVVIPTNTPGGTYLVRVIRTVSTSPLIQVPGSSSPTRLTVRPLPAATLSGTQNLYEGGSTTLTVSFGGDGPWSFVYTDSTRTVPGTATTTPYLIPVQPLKTTTYRLLSVTNNCGTGAVSGVAVITVLPLLGVEQDPLSDVVKAYPVPATTRLTVTIDRPLYTESALLELVDLRGQATLQRTTRSKQTELDLSGQPGGTYLLRVTLGDKQTTRKILIQ